ncbi:DUF1801 domain-containing protein [Mariniphaga sediminis]|uniref:DUF1801 domain-containing protein n=1 Tax=Mariniphaga sediminis TaxID=1628158 RepID=A0A399D118_9BACT|nr:DUF1801 domain-containing protein [Mariniphaga sediminis]RIH65267.1 DUF1801 domain-containing protein [Mariniphaga sediminis]
MKNEEVTKFLNGINHPLRNEIERLRDLIVSAESQLTENIKWNGPNYCFRSEDRITMRIQPPKQIQIVFHRGAKKLAQSNGRLISETSGLLVWKENDRAVATFKNLNGIELQETEFKNTISKWIAATKE